MSNKIFYQGQPGASSAVVDTATKDGIIDAVTAHNPDGTDRDLDVWLDASGSGGAVDATKVYSGTVATGATETIPIGGHAFPKGAKIYLQSSSADTLTVTISGRS